MEAILPREREESINRRSSALEESYEGKDISIKECLVRAGKQTIQVNGHSNRYYVAAQVGEGPAEFNIREVFDRAISIRNVRKFIDLDNANSAKSKQRELMVLELKE